MLRDVGELEILQAPGLPYIIPREYTDLTHLTGAPAFHFRLLSWQLCAIPVHTLTGARRTMQICDSPWTECSPISVASEKQ